MISQVDEAFQKLRKLYKVVQDDPYQRQFAGGTAGFKRYLRRFDRMMDGVSGALSFVGRCPFTTDFLFCHDVWTHIEMAKYDKTEEDRLRDREVLAEYLKQVGGFINTRKLDSYSLYDSNDKRWWKYEYIEKDGCYSIIDGQLKEYDANEKRSILVRYRAAKKKGGWSDPDKHWSPHWKSMARRLMEREREARK
jgi:hypothetical protein